jgi:hypothetical protein
MSRMDRLKEYAKPLRPQNWQGETNDMANIDRWSGRATANSHLAPRATGIDETVMPHSTGKSMDMRSTTTAPREARNVDKRMVAKDDMNNVGDSPYLRGVRRQA